MRVTRNIQGGGTEKYIYGGELYLIPRHVRNFSYMRVICELYASYMRVICELWQYLYNEIK